MSGKLSTHVLDTYHGKPAAGMAWRLFAVFEEGERVMLKEGATNQDGRTDELLLTGDALKTGQYRLEFGVGEYFKSQKVVLAEPQFLENVALEVNLSAGQNYHVPLLVSPWSYSTYRGS